MTTGKVVGSILFPADQLLGVEELAVCSSPHLVNDSGLQIHKNGTGNMLPSTSFAEKGVESIITSPNGLVTWHLAIRLPMTKKKLQIRGHKKSSKKDRL